MYSQQSLKKMQERQNHVKKRAEREQQLKKIEKYWGDRDGKFKFVDKLNYQEAKLRLKNKLRKGDITVSNINLIDYGNPQGLKHFISKAVLGYVLINHKQHFSSEVLDCDCYWIERDTAIEIEKNYSPSNVKEKIEKFKKTFYDVLIFNLNLIPDDPIKMQIYFIHELGL